MTEKSEWQFLVDYVKDDTTDSRNAWHSIFDGGLRL